MNVDTGVLSDIDWTNSSIPPRYVAVQGSDTEIVELSAKVRAMAEKAPLGPSHFEDARANLAEIRLERLRREQRG